MLTVWPTDGGVCICARPSSEPGAPTGWISKNSHSVPGRESPRRVTPAGWMGSALPLGARSWAAAIPVSARPGLHAFRWKSKQWVEQALLSLDPPPLTVPCSAWTCCVNSPPSCGPGLTVLLSQDLWKIMWEIKNWRCFMGYPDTLLRRNCQRAEPDFLWVEVFFFFFVLHRLKTLFFLDWTLMAYATLNWNRKTETCGKIC